MCALQRMLADEAAQWNAAQRDVSYLLIGAHLEQFGRLGVEHNCFIDQR
jgi:hypothetical protein